MAGEPRPPSGEGGGGRIDRKEPNETLYILCAASEAFWLSLWHIYRKALPAWETLGSQCGQMSFL